MAKTSHGMTSPKGQHVMTGANAPRSKEICSQTPLCAVALASCLGWVLFFLLLFLAALGLRCCARAFSSCSERGLLFVVVRGLLIVVASLVVEHGL